MEPRTLTRPLRVLRVCLHLLVFGLATLAAARALVDGRPHAAWVVVAAAVVVAGYAAGPLLPHVVRSRAAAGAWLAVLGVAWLGLLWLTPDGVWLAFPLFLLQLHLLSGWSGPAAVVLTTGLAIAGFAGHQHALTVAAVLGPTLGAAVAVATVLGYQALYRESEQRRRLIEELTAARGELAVAERQAGVLAERERLAREIHDTLAQGLSSIQLLLRAAERALPADPGTAEGHVRQARAQAQRDLAEARRFVHALTPPELAHGSLPSALRRLCAVTEAQSGLTVRFRLDGDPVAVPTQQEVALLRIAQSALANTVQHAAASRSEITLSYLGTTVTMDAVDDGIGFDPGTLPDGGFGLAGMRARASELGGGLTVESAPGKGTALAVSFAR